MRTLRKGMLIAMMVMVAAVSFANGNRPNVKIEKVSAKTIVLYASELGNSNTKIQLKDEDGVILYQIDTDNNKKVNQRFDLKALPVGNYSLEVENESSFNTTPIEVTHTALTVKEDDQVTITKPIIRQNGDLLDIIMPSEGDGEVSIMIFDGNANRLYKETVESSSELRRYNLSKLAKGGYTVKMNTKGKDFIQFVALK